MKIETSDLSEPDVLDLIDFHVRANRQHCGSHVLATDQLKSDGVILFAARDHDGALMGVVGLKTLSKSHGEIKSVRTHPDHLRKGVSGALLTHIFDHARSIGMSRLSLETHPTDDFAAARAMFHRFGFERTGPFADYEDTDNSVFFTRSL